MLLVPALPIAGPGGEVSRISRAEFWMILVASFETIWNQWTSGQPPTISDRFPKIACAMAWLDMCALLGLPIARWDRLTNRMNRFNTLAWSIAVGSSIASLCVAGNAMTFGPQSRLGLIGWLLGVGITLYLCLGSVVLRKKEEVDGGQTSPVTTNTQTHDPALSDSWARRLMGLTSLGIVWVLMLMLLGACLPTYDADVREHRIMAMRNIYLADQWDRFDNHREANLPQGAMMPALFWMNVFVGRPPDPLDVDAIDGMVESVLVNQIVQGIYWCFAIWILIGSLSQIYGLFAAVIVGFAMAAHPGLFELVRLGGGAGEGGMILVATASLLLQHRFRELPFGSLACISAGAIGQGWVMFLLVTVPIATRLVLEPNQSLLWRSSLLIFQGAVSVFWGGAFVESLVRAGWPWGRAGEGALAACSRIVFFSTTHSLHLIPIAMLGWLFTRDRAGRDAGIWFCLWCLLWWIATPQQDRDWVLALPLLAWPMASGVVWLRERGQGILLLAVGGLALAWSIMVLNAWPTSDNRLLVPLDSLSPVVALVDTGEGRGGGTARADLAPSVNRIWNGLDNEQKRKKWLLLGSADAFRWLPNVDLCGTHDDHPWGKSLKDWESDSDLVRVTRQSLEQNKIGYVVLDWEGWKYRDRLLGTNRESKYRDAIRVLQQNGAFRRVEWEFDSGRAECYEVIEASSAK